MAGEKKEQQVLLDEESLKVLETLVEVAVKLKESGMLDMLRVLAEKSSDIFAYISNEVKVHRLMTLGDGAIAAVEKLSPEEVVTAKLNVANMSECLFKSLANVRMDKIRPISTTGLLRALGDKDVQMGLGLLMGLAKELGACVRAKLGR